MWKTIDTAPKDGSAVLVMRDNWPGTPDGRAAECDEINTYVVAWWANASGTDGEWTCYMDAVLDPKCPIDPTHWMPLPLPPKSQEAGK